MIATEEQRAAVESALKTSRAGDALKIVAGPGTGKTATLRMIAKALHQANGSGHRILYLAYNRALKEEAKEKFGDTVDVHTLHSLAFKALKLWKRERAIGRRLTVAVAVDLLGLGSGADARAKRALQTMSEFATSSATDVSADHVPSWLLQKKPLEAERAAQDARELFEATRADANARGVALPHDVYLKTWDVLGAPGLEWYDTVLFDEAQDASPVILRALSKVRHTISVGDENQQIYGWRGAVDAMSQISGTTRALTLSFRFGPAIASAANRILSAKTPAVSYRLRGNESLRSQVRRLDTSRTHTRLYRTNEAAIGDVVFLEDIERQPAVVGGASGIADLLDSVWTLYTASAASVRNPRIRAFDSWSKLRDACTKKAGVESDIRQAVNMVDLFEERVPDVVKTLDQGRTEREALTLISTAHKSKGREWDQVLVASDFDDSLESDNDELANDELNLAYVAITRARHRLEIQSDLINDIVEEV